jgi:hypothetical protein
MSYRISLIRATLAGALCLVLGTAQAFSGAPEGASGYYQSCLQSVQFPKPFGEWDLKGNPKLPEYCECYVPLFAKQTSQSRANLQVHGGPPTPEMIKENKAAELNLRNTCRKQVGLPLVYDPNINSPAARDRRAKEKAKKAGPRRQNLNTPR